MSASAFASVLDAAKAQAASNQVIEELRRQAAKEAAQRRAQLAADDAAKQQVIRNCRNFGEGFLSAVAKMCSKKVAERRWKDPVSTVQAIEAYSTALLKQGINPSELPSLDSQLAEQVLDKFAYGLALAEKRSQAVPDNTFVGQRIIGFSDRLERKREEVKSTEVERQSDRIIWSSVPVAKPSGPRPSAADAKVTDNLPPAYTPKRKKQKKSA